MRWLITRNFERLVSTEISNIRSIAVIGGSSKEPELNIFAGLPVQVNYFGIEFEKNHDLENFYMDLNIKSNLRRSYDLVICSQVLEHVWNHQNTFDNLTKLVNNGGFLFIACPTSNFAHGSPNYFSAGFTSDYISRNLEVRNFEVIEEGMLGSRRNYIATHLFHIWLSERLHQRPWLALFSKLSTKHRISTVIISIFNKKILSSSIWATESYAFLSKTKKGTK
jgi:SAM-dependent methyltransferase